MKLRLTPQILSAIPGLSAAVIIVKNLNNKRKSSSVEQLLRGACAQKRTQLKRESEREKFDQIIKKASNISTDNETGKQSQILPEAQLLESVIKKISKEKDLPLENNLSGLIHYIGLKYLLPIFGHDLDQVEQDLEIDFISPKRGKKALDLEFTPDTKNAVFWLIDLGTIEKDRFAKLPGELAKLIEKYCKCDEQEIHFLNSETPQIDLNYISDKESEFLAEQMRLASEKAVSEQIIESDNPPFMDADLQSAQQFEQEPSLKDQLSKVLTQTVNQLLKNETQTTAAEIQIEVPAESIHGDYASSIALKLSKQLGKNPREIAEEIQKLLTDPTTGSPKLDYIQKIEIAGPGFLNFYLSQSHLEKQLDQILKLRSNFGRLTIGKGQKVLIEYSSPNIAKPLGAHHLLTTIIGQTLADMLKFCGYETVCLNWLGDWGTQFGKLIYAYRLWGSEEVVKKDPLNELLKLYVRFHDEAEKDPTMEDKGREEFKKLEEGDSENFKLWQWIKDISKQEVERLYQILGVHFDEYLGEQMYLESAKKLVEEGREKGIIIEGEKGALIVSFDEGTTDPANESAPKPLQPYMLQKGDGTTLYSTRDLASIKDRIERYQPYKMIYVVDVAQSLHFKQLFATARKFNFFQNEEVAATAADTDTADTKVPELIHVSFGRMQLPEGKMSTRKGEIIILDEMIKEAVSRTEKLIETKSPQLPETEKKQLALDMAVSAIKYNIISQNRETNMIFEWDRILSLDGNSGPYLQYACARAQSILRKYREAQEIKAQESKSHGNTEQMKAKAKATKSADKFLTNQNQISIFAAVEQAESVSNAEEAKPITENAGIHDQADLNRKPFEHPTEQHLLHLLPRFPERLEQATNEYKPNLLTNYLFELARAFSSFYNEVQVLNAANEELKISRLKLVEATAQVLKNGLKLVGITVFERM